MDHRGFLGGVGLALLSFGASLLIAYGTVGYSKGQEFNWLTGYSRLGESLIAVGVMALVATFILIERQKWKLKQIDALTGLGNALMDRLEISVTNGQSSIIDELNLEIIDWEGTVDAWLLAYLPQYLRYFRNRGGHVDLMWEHVPPTHMVNDDTSSYAVNISMLNGHLSRLAEIEMKL
ncbi:MAG: hypothetical protein WA359_09025 [Acidimicrobiales bacterium]